MVRRVVIVGGGVAGLAAALALTKSGIDSTILERRNLTALDGEGAGIQIGPNGTKVLSSLGVLDTLRRFAQVPDGIRVHDGQRGRLLTVLPLGNWIAERHSAPYWVVHRADLITVLAEAARAAGVTLVDDATVVSVRQDDSGVSASSGSESVRGDILIGADGLWSSVREAHFDARRPTFTGRVAWRAVLPPDVLPQLARRDVSVWMSPSSHLVSYPIRSEGALNVVLISPGAPIAERWSGMPGDDEVRRHFAAEGPLARFHSSLHVLGREVIGWRRWPLMARAPLASFAKGRIALIGDAAHPMLPFLAQGGVMALEDATALAQALLRHPGEAEAALRAYSAARRERSYRVVAAAERNGHIYHLDGFKARVRDAALMAGAGALVMRNYDWLYGGPTETPV